LLDLKIRLDELQFLAQGDLLCADVVECAAQQLAEASEHAVGQLDVAVHQGGDGLQRVEKEVRVELHLQHLQLCLYQLSLQLKGSQFALAELAVIDQAVSDAKDQPVSQHKEDDLADQVGEQDLRVCSLAPERSGRHDPDERDRHGKNDQRRTDTGNCMEQDSSPVHALQGI